MTRGNVSHFTKSTRLRMDGWVREEYGFGSSQKMTFERKTMSSICELK